MSTEPKNTTKAIFQDPEYQQQRQSWLGIIRKSALLDSVRSNADRVNFVLASAAIAAIISGIIHIPVVGILALLGGSLLAAGVSFYAAYKNETMSKGTGLKFSEMQHVANSRISAKELAGALKETFVDEPKAALADAAMKADALQKLQANKADNWKERVQLSEQSVSQSIN